MRPLEGIAVVALEHAIAADTPWFDDDLALCAMEGVSGVMLPKAESRLVPASRLAGIAAPVDGVTVTVSDRARLGFGGKLCIHPNQLAIVNTAFAPSAAEMDWARKVVAAADGESGAFRPDGKMVDRPVILRAQAVLQAHAARAAA